MLKKLLFTLGLLAVSISANELDSLLDEFAQESDLSLETKQERSGQLLLYTRNDLEKMKVRTLKDILKYIPSFSYRENQHANPDVFSTGNLYSSTTQARIYIDNQEIANGVFGSTYSIFGNIDLDFVDHIEIYTIAPGYGLSVDTNNLLIKLYSKNASRDAGGTASLRYGSRDTHQETLSYSQKNDTFNYYAYGSNSDEKRMSKNGFLGTELNNDKKDIHLFANFNTEKDTLQVNYLKRDQNAYAGVSLTASPLKANTDIEYLHIGYERDIVDNLALQIAYDKTDYTLGHVDAIPFVPSTNITTFDNAIEDELFTAKLHYTLKTENNSLTAGVKYRHNNFTNNEKLGFIEYSNSMFDQQKTITYFLENTYSLTQGTSLVAALKHVDIKNNGSISNDAYTSYRLGAIYENDTLLMKMFFNADSSMPANYSYVSSIYSPENPNTLKMQGIDALTFSIENKDNNLYGQFVASYVGLSNTLIVDPSTLKLISYETTMKAYSAYINANYKIDTNNELKTLVAYGRIDHLFLDIDDSGTINGHVSLFNTFGKVSLYNSVYFQDTLDNSRDLTFEYALGISYQVNDSLELSLKGDNLFYSGDDSTAGFSAFNPTSFEVEWIPHQVTDRLVLAQMKYYF